MSLEGAATVNITTTTFTGSSAGSGGSLCASNNGTLLVAHCLVNRAQATINGGGMFADGDSFLKVMDTTVLGCSAKNHGGGLNVYNQAMLELINSTVINNTAGMLGKVNTAVNSHGGGVALWEHASILLEGSHLANNYAQYAGGGLLLEKASKVACRGSRPTFVHLNTALTTGGGVRLRSNLAMDTALTCFDVARNHAPSSADISMDIASIEVIRSNGKNLIASDSRDGFLQVTLNVSGANGLPSSDDMTYTLFDAKNTNLVDQTIHAQGTGLKKFAISLKRPPGTLR